MNMANELDLRRKQEISGQQPLQTLADRLTLADHLVYKKYLTELRSYGLMPLSQEKLVAQDPMECIRMYQLKELTVKKARICSKSSPRCTIPAWRWGAALR